MKVCRNCKKRLPAHKANFCSRKCRRQHAANGPKLLANCVICGAPLTGHQRKYCSVECRTKHYEHIQEQKKIECVICGGIFTSYKGKKTCSEECRLILRKQRDKAWREKDAIDYYATKAQTKIRPCLKCGKDFETTVDWICPPCHEVNERLYGGVDDCYVVGRNTQWKRAKVSQI